MLKNFLNSLHDAVSRAHKLLNILELALHCFQELGLRPFAWAVALSMTELTSINGSITISPEGGS